jgi:lipopolysaccharide export system protein LptA
VSSQQLTSRVAVNEPLRLRSLAFLLSLLAACIASTPLPAEEATDGGLITIESDRQSADNSTGVITASGNVRLIHVDRGVVATSRQAQYFVNEERIVLSGDVDVVQGDGNRVQAERLIYLLDEERALATPGEGQQVFSQWSLQLNQPETTSPAP